jgi:hypothetical protein
MSLEKTKRVIGLGGIFFKAKDPQQMYAWYEKHLGIQGKPEEGAMFHWRRADDPSQESLYRVVNLPTPHKVF